MTDDMLMAASETLPDLIRPTDMSLGRVFPRLADIRRGLIGLCVPLVPHTPRSPLLPFLSTAHLCCA